MLYLDCITNDFQSHLPLCLPPATRGAKDQETFLGEQGIMIGPRQFSSHNLNLLSTNCDRFDSMYCCKYLWRYYSLVVKTSLDIGVVFFYKLLPLKLFTVPTQGTASKRRLDQFHIICKRSLEKNSFGVFPDMPKPSQTSNSIECNGLFKAQLDSLTESA